ncbi:MAG: glycogen synthase GlgA [Clostridia bacterium]|nr:glycogen synthase GlgA [Clostridia bacterium]
MQTGSKLKILYVSAEVSPFAKTGGLADVAGSLPQTLAAMGNDVRVVMPRYKTIKSGMSYVADFPVVMGDRRETCIVRETETNYKADGKTMKMPVYFIDSYHYYDREGIYCYMDDADRFVFFCKAVLEMLPRINFQPDVIHCNDWHTGPICLLLKEKYKRYPFYSNMSAVFTIHNLEYQGHFSKDTLRVLNMGEDVFTPEKAEFYGGFNFMKAGLVYTDIINAVSETYAEEVKTERYGEKMEGLLNKRAKDLYGIVNGISYEEFNPAEDPKIYKNYSLENYEDKKQNKYALQKEVGLPKSDKPLIGIVHRLTAQKGLDLILDVMDEIMESDVQFVLLGLGDPYYENKFKEYAEKYPDKMKVIIEFNVTLAQRIYSGSDVFLMPSRFEPCGLGQLISLRYGTIPIVRSTGGLADTVLDFNADEKQGNGFTFTDYTSEAFLNALKRAIKVYNQKPEAWDMLIQRALESDFSWKTSAEKYLKLYKLAVEKQEAKEKLA